MFLDGKPFPWDAPLYADEMRIITRQSTENQNAKISKKSKTKK